MAATLDVLSGGRLRMGIVLVGPEPIHRAAGFSFLPPERPRVARLEETLQTLLRLVAANNPAGKISRSLSVVMANAISMRARSPLRRYRPTIGFEDDLAEYVISAPCSLLIAARLVVT